MSFIWKSRVHIKRIITLKKSAAEFFFYRKLVNFAFTTITVSRQGKEVSQRLLRKLLLNGLLMTRMKLP